MNLEPGQVVVVTTPGSGAVVGRIEEWRAPADAGSIEGLTADQVRRILQDANIERVATISYNPVAGNTMLFTALRNRNGTWRDLRGTPLIIEPTR